jgi:hypothetical protein
MIEPGCTCGSSTMSTICRCTVEYAGRWVGATVSASSTCGWSLIERPVRVMRSTRARAGSPAGSPVAVRAGAAPRRDAPAELKTPARIEIVSVMLHVIV